ncbi:MAG: hypothetical protein VX899_26660 [Myxococcota bacterium]|nr:hypothetical protein [Myxococcota bacterium]
MIWSLALVAPAVAQESSDEEAKELYAKGEAAYADQEYEQALTYWQAAYDLSERPLILYNMAAAYEKLGRYPEAIAALDEYWRYAPESERGIIERRISQLEAKLPEGTESPSDHGGGGGGGLSFDPGWLLVGAGTAAIATGATFGVMSRQAGATLSESCVDGLCLERNQVDVESNRKQAMIADIAMAGGIVLAGSGVALVLVDDGSVVLSPTAGGLLLEGSF